MKNCVIGFILGLFVLFLLGAAPLRYIDGHCQSSLSNIGLDGEVYLAITNTTTGTTVVHRFDRNHFSRNTQAVFTAEQIMENPRIARTLR